MLAFDEDAHKELSPKQAGYRRLRDPADAATHTTNRLLNQPNHAVFVAEQDSRLIGFVAGYITLKHFRVLSQEGYVEYWFVEKAYRERHIGRRLFDLLVTYFRSSGCSHVALDTNVDRARNIAMYEQMGFDPRHISFIRPLSGHV